MGMGLLSVEELSEEQNQRNSHTLTRSHDLNSNFESPPVLRRRFRATPFHFPTHRLTTQLHPSRQSST